MISFSNTYTPLPSATSFFPSKKISAFFVVASLLFSHRSSYAQAQTATPSLTPSSTPSSTPLTCADEQALLDQDAGLQSAYLTFGFSTSYNSGCDCSTYTTSDNKMSAVEDACNAANGNFYSTGYTSVCPDRTTYYTNEPWCVAQSCTFDEHFDAWASNLEGNGCSYTQGTDDMPEFSSFSFDLSDDSAGLFVMSSTYQFMFVSSVIMLFLHK